MILKAPYPNSDLSATDTPLARIKSIEVEITSHIVLHLSQFPHDVYRIRLSCGFLHRWILV